MTLTLGKLNKKYNKIINKPIVQNKKNLCLTKTINIIFLVKIIYNLKSFFIYPLKHLGLFHQISM